MFIVESLIQQHPEIESLACQHEPYKALYLHVPFCKSKCNYCDFDSCAMPKGSNKIAEYVDNLSFEVRKQAMRGELADIETIYIGGGTPTHIGNGKLSSLLYMISLSVKLEQVQEFSVEANPESVTPEIIKDMFALGVNRLSMGVQSFDDDVLRVLGRVHDAKQAVNAYKIARERFDNISIDLMCGIPGQSMSSFEKSLKTAIGLGVDHLSVYPLIVEDGTPFAKMMQSGQMSEVDSDVQADHMELAHKMLTDAGYQHYEVASYALPGKESKHNLKYWNHEPYLGLGRSATTMMQNKSNRARITNGKIDDFLNASEMLAEDFMLAMRTCYGVDKEEVNKSEKIIGDNRAQTAFGKLIDAGLVKEEAQMTSKKPADDTIRRYVPTFKGWMLGNEIYSTLLDLI